MPKPITKQAPYPLARMVCPTLPSELQELVMADWYEELHKRMHKRKYELCMRFFMSGAVQNIVTHWEYWNECVLLPRALWKVVGTILM